MEPKSTAGKVARSILDHPGGWNNSRVLFPNLADLSKARSMVYISNPIGLDTRNYTPQVYLVYSVFHHRIRLLDYSKHVRRQSRILGDLQSTVFLQKKTRLQVSGRS